MFFPCLSFAPWAKNREKNGALRLKMIFQKCHFHEIFFLITYSIFTSGRKFFECPSQKKTFWKFSTKLFWKYQKFREISIHCTIMKTSFFNDLHFLNTFGSYFGFLDLICGILGCSPFGNNIQCLRNQLRVIPRIRWKYFFIFSKVQASTLYWRFNWCTCFIRHSRLKIE